MATMPSAPPSNISCNTYNWLTFYNREGKSWGEHLHEDIATYAKSGLTAIEPAFNTASMAKEWIAVLKENKISLPSIYVSTLLHESTEVNKSIDTVLEIAKVVKEYGTRIIVTNPSPISWTNKQNKTDDQLILQARSLDLLGSKLRTMGLRLAYHTHDMEMMAGAREFHHMMQNTSPLNISYCMDVHWIFRGSQNSAVAVYDIIKMYGHRIIELHIRQSTHGIWNEVFTAIGDIDYIRVASMLRAVNRKPQLVIEQCIENQSPNTMNVVDAHKMDLIEVQKVFRS